MRISDWSSDVCSSDLPQGLDRAGRDAGDDVEPHAAIDDEFMDDADLKRALRAAAAQYDCQTACHVRLLGRGQLTAVPPAAQGALRASAGISAYYKSLARH